MSKPAPRARAAADTSTRLKGGQEGTVFRALTVEGEDRVHIEFERPKFQPDLDPEQVAAIQQGGALQTLARGAPDPVAPLLAVGARDLPQRLARPWLSEFSGGAVARFQPQVTGAERWRLGVADSRGRQVATFEGRGDPPREIAWDGSSTVGPAVPGLTYSYALEAFDRAGNKRNFVGPGFRVPAYRIDDPAKPALAFSAEALGPGMPLPGSEGVTAPPVILLEAASRIDQGPLAGRRIRVTATARGAERARTLADGVTRWLAAYTLGDPARIHAVPVVEAEAPEAGTVRIEPEP